MTVPARVALVLAFVITIGVLPAVAQRVGTVAQWKKRVLDPTTIDLEVFPTSKRNLKFTIDFIRLDETKAKMIVYLIEADQMPAASEFYARQVGQPVETSGIGTTGELRIVRAAADDPKRAGLLIRVEHARWATGKGQVRVVYEPPGEPESGEPKPGEPGPEEPKAGQVESPEAEPEEPKPGKPQSGELEPGAPKPGEP